METKPVKKRINFYQIQAEKNINKNEEKLTYKEIKDFFDDVYSDLKTNKDGYKYEYFETFEKYMIEYIVMNEKEMFVRIGKETPENVIGKRNHDTGNLSNIELDNGETIETYTYLYVDFENCIMSFLMLSGAPSRVVFEKYLNSIDQTITFDCTPITTNNILEKIINKSILGTIQYSYCNPKENVLKDIPGVTDTVLDSLNINKSTISVSLAPPRNKSLTRRAAELLKIKDDLEQLHNNDLKKISINARDEDETMVTYNLLDYKFNSYVSIQMINTLNENDFKKIIIHAYNKQKKDLCNHIRD
ncbi:hypothetical protein [Thomasclavelia sp.]|uniref:hypothetical protein n=1 Tax=Thomasclavelia sp. TaxID=3025757 RepID=UPI0025DC32A9|nr:hypothetical protein [Thomasclavelia sp.]